MGTAPYLLPLRQAQVDKKCHGEPVEPQGTAQKCTPAIKSELLKIVRYSVVMAEVG